MTDCRPLRNRLTALATACSAIVHSATAMWPRTIAILLIVAGIGSSAAAQRPNVVLILADDMNSYAFDDRGIRARTPNLDKLRTESLTFTRAYCAAPVCAPSRAAIFSGRFPHRTGFYFNGADGWNDSKTLKKTETLLELVRRSGYKTWGGGKLLHAKMPSDRHDAQWDNDPKTYGAWGPYLEGEDQMGSKSFGVKPWEGPDEDFPDVRCLQDVRDFLHEEHYRPFFMVVGLWRPHAPWTAPKRFFELYDPNELPIPMSGVQQDLDDVPKYGKLLAKIFGKRWQQYGTGDHDAWRKILHGYLASTSFADWTIGQIKAAVDESPYGDNTIFIVTSDNGYHVGEKAHFGHATLWDQATRVPLIIQTPEMPAAGDTCSQPVSLLDLYPTLIDLCPLETPSHRMDGKSLSALIEDPEAEEAGILAITTYGAKMLAIREGPWSYILYRDGGKELYHLGRDPQELRNVADESSSAKTIKSFNEIRPKKWAKSLGGKKG